MFILFLDFIKFITQKTLDSFGQQSYTSFYDIQKRRPLMDFVYEIAEYAPSFTLPLCVMRWKIYIEDEETANKVYKSLDVPSYRLYTGTSVSKRMVLRSEAVDRQVYTKETIREFNEYANTYL